MSDTIKLSEYFKGFQGEGMTQGKLSVFVRFIGCPLQCEFCDSKYSWNDQDSIEVPIDQIIDDIDKVNNVVFTGGEPLTKQNVKHIVQILDDIQHPEKVSVEIETSGVIDSTYKQLINFQDMDINDPFKSFIFNISPKTNIKQLNNVKTYPKLLSDYHFRYWFDYIYKPIVRTIDDFVDIEKMQKKYVMNNDQIWVQPYGTSYDEMKSTIHSLEKEIIARNWNLSPRLHILLFGDKKGV